MTTKQEWKLVPIEKLLDLNETMEVYYTLEQK